MRDWSDESGSLNFIALRGLYGRDELKPRDVAKTVIGRIARRGKDGVWIYLEPEEKVFARAEELESLAEGLSAEALLSRYPLYGLPFAIKDNIDWMGRPTTAGCPEYTYVPEKTAPAVERLLDAGTILIGKTNMDQFATGLVGVRSPYGVARNPFDERFIPGGSSSGSAVAVSAGLVSFALGTDTAGSGRVPAGFNNIVGLKPTRGLVSMSGVVPACRSLDCASVFALTVPDALEALRTMAEEDESDPFSRSVPHEWIKKSLADSSGGLRVGVPRKNQREFFGNENAEELFNGAIDRLRKMGTVVVEIDYTTFHETARLVYEGPWMAERYAAIRKFFDAKPEALHPVTRDLIVKGRGYSASDTFGGIYRLEGLKKITGKTWDDIDMMVVPTTGTIYSISEVESDPIALNNNLSFYTNFMNLLDLCGIAVPNGFYSNGLPAGVTFIAPAFQESGLCALGTAFQRESGLNLGATPHPIPAE